ncbi:MAG: hypothetical protein ABL977_14405 [Candidatus Eisenbacteria bacterium]
MSRSRRALSALARVVPLLLAAAGCSKLHPPTWLNLRPSVEFTQAPVSADPADRAFYAYKVFWSGNDPDGKVDHFEYCIDPAGAETTWVATPKSEETLFFRSPEPDPITGAVRTAQGFHVLVLRAVDNHGARSAVRSRSFYSWTVAPSVSIVAPLPNRLIDASVTPSVIIHWQGQDPDGQRTQRPVSYRYKLFKLSDPRTTGWMLSDSDSLRRQEARNGFAGWDSSGADTTVARYTNLAPKSEWLFVVVAFDEAGAYSPVFSPDENMLHMVVSTANENGPRIHVFNEFVDFTYDSGGYTADPLRWIKLEAPFGTTLRFHWDALASPGATIQDYRWCLDIPNLTDETQRSDEENDYVHWSHRSAFMTSCVLRGLSEGVHLLYIEARDNNGFASLGVVAITVVKASFERDLLVVDDTRYEVDKQAATGCLGLYTTRWPTATELDTFLYARGGVPWRCTADPAAASLSAPGVMSGYSYDTLGTRRGFEIPTLGARLADIGHYRHVIWMVDGLGAGNIDATSPIAPSTVLRFMSAAGHASTLAAFTLAGGRVWLCGGGSATASLADFNKRRNDTDAPVFSNVEGELVSGRILYDGAHWRSALQVARRAATVRRAARAEQMVSRPWSHPDAWGGPDVRSPDYTRLPAEMRRRDPATDPMPPTRGDRASLYYLDQFALEYLIEPNLVIEDVDPDADAFRFESVLDTLMEAESFALPRSPAPVMTRYHGSEANQFVFSGFAPWDFRRDDCIQLFDFVLQELWRLPRQGVDRGNTSTRAAGRGRPVAVTPAQRQLQEGARRE